MSGKVRKYCTIAITVAFFVFQMYLALVKQMTVMLQTPLHMCFALTLVFLYNPIDKGYQKKLKKKAEKEGKSVTDAELNKWAKLRWIDLIFYAAIIFVVAYTISNVERLRNFDKVTSEVFTIDYVAMVCIIILLLEAVRRTLGNVLFFFIIAFIVYSWTAQYFPKGSVFYTKGKSFAKMLKTFCSGMILTESGVYGTPLTTSCTSLFYFIAFGAFFSECGGGQLLIDIGMKFSNKSSGGPAKAAVISSGLMGMVSGSAVANVATTGVMTIPMMKKIGYEPAEAGAIEAVASTGGQVMPPIMGIGAFIMAEMLGINYLTVAADAIIPAFAYYFGVFVVVSMLAKRRAARTKTSESGAKIEVKRALLPRMYLLLPVVVLIASIMKGNSLMRSGMYGIFVCLACNVLSFFLDHGMKDTWNNIVNGVKDGNFAGLKQLWKSMLDGAKSAAEIAIPTAACGIIIDVMTEQTSLAINLSKVIAGLGVSNLFVALLIAMIGCMLLGMALPTVAAYLVGVTLFVPTLKSLGISPLVANMFVFYYGIMAQITPPVCVASYTAAGIAGADAMKTGLRGMLFALVGFLCPFVFVYNPAILLQGPVIEIIIGAAQLLAGTFFLGLAVSGFYRRELPWWVRLVFVAVALGFIIPYKVNLLVVAAALVVGVALMTWLIMSTKKEKTTAA